MLELEEVSGEMEVLRKELQSVEDSGHTVFMSAKQMLAPKKDIYQKQNKISWKKKHIEISLNSLNKDLKGLEQSSEECALINDKIAMFQKELSDLNQEQSYKINAFTNNKHSEVGWFYPSASSNEVDRYVIYNYLEKVWYYGQLSRTAWLDAGIENYPQAASSSYLYEHEKGFDNDGAEMRGVFIESSDFDLGDGDSFAFLRKIIPDVKFLDDDSSSNVNIVTKTRNFPGDSLTTDNTATVTPSTQQEHMRARGRQAAVRIASNDGDSGNVGVGWRLGALRYDIRPDGKK